MTKHLVLVIILAAAGSLIGSYVDSISDSFFSEFIVSFIFFATIGFAFSLSPKRRAEREAKKSDIEKK